MPVRDKPSNRYDHSCGQITMGIKSVTNLAAKYYASAAIWQKAYDTKTADCSRSRLKRIILEELLSVVEAYAEGDM
jgi:hypothetical protein